MLKKFPEKINVTKYALVFLLHAPTHYNLTFNLQFLYDLRQNFHFSKRVWYFPFSIPFRFY